MKTAKPYIYVTVNGPDDGGDFGPHTPGTKTSGIQEAVDYAINNQCYVFICGAMGGMHDGREIPGNVYNLQETLRIPWSQDFEIRGGTYVLNYELRSGDAVCIDSMMNCSFDFGIIGARTDGAAIRVKPQTKGPDDFIIAIASKVTFAALVNHGPGYGLILDSEKGPIVHSRFTGQEINSTHCMLKITDNGGKGSGVYNNDIEFLFGNMDHSLGESNGLIIGEEGTRNIAYNRIRCSICSPRGVYFDETEKAYIPLKDFHQRKEIALADIYAQNNRFDLQFSTNFHPGTEVLLRESAEGNTLMLNGGKCLRVDNRALGRNDAIRPQSSGGLLETPDMPLSNVFLRNPYPWTALVYITDSGKISSWEIINSQNERLHFDGGLFTGQMITLQSGDSIRFKYTEPVKWIWRNN